MGMQDQAAGSQVVAQEWMGGVSDILGEINW